MTDVFRKLRLTLRLAWVVLISSERIKEVFNLGIRVISPLVVVVFICKFPNLKVEKFRDEFLILVFDSFITELVTRGYDESSSFSIGFCL